MNDWTLPDDLQRLEDELKALPRPALPASLLTGMDRNTCIRQRGGQRRPWYAFVAGAAASALLWANLSFNAAIATDFHLDGPLQQSNTAQLEEQLHDLLPDLDARELRRQTVMIRASSRLAGPVSTTQSRPLTGTDPLL